MVVRCVVIPTTPASDPLKADQDNHESEHHQGDLRRTAGIAHAEPDFENRHGQCVNGEIVHSSEIRQGLHECQRQSRRQSPGGPGAGPP